MNHEIISFLSITVAVAIIHTLLGPDHYAPLAAFAKAQHWTKRKIVWITSFCGLGHILSSVVLGSIGVFLNFSLEKWKIVNSLRQEIAAWLWIAAGVFYLVWAMKDWYRHKCGSDAFPGGNKTGAREWIFFVIFVLGPCEPLILLMQHPIVRGSLSVGLLVAGIFGVTTILTMMVSVLALSAGLDSFPGLKGNYAHFAAAGIMIFCGAGMKFLGF